MEPPISEVERVYREFWAPIVEYRGFLDMEQVKKELYDFWLVMDNVPKVYDYVTGGKVSKVLTDPDFVKSLADEHYEEICSED